MDKCSITKDKERSIIRNSNKLYYFERVDNLDEVIDQYNLAKDYDYFYRFILNKDDSIITQYAGNYYVLLEDNSSYRNEYSIDDNSLSLNNLSRLMWRDLWIRKSDYIEYYYSHIIGKYRLIDESIDYYLGMLEMAIYYLYDYVDYSDVSFVEHKTFNEKNLFNPLNLKVDVKERDFSEYLKYIFFNNIYKEVDIEKIIIKYKDYYNYDLIVSRLLYPNFYFDLFDRVILNGESESVLYQVISRTQEYEDYLKRIVDCVSTFFEIKKIDWL